MFKIKISDGTVFECAGNENLLAAAARQQIVFPYSCKTGRCSSCKGKITQGESHVTHAELGLSDAEKAQGWGLTCVRVPDSDLSLEIESLGVVLPAEQTLPCRIDSIEYLLDDVVKVILRLPPSSQFGFLAGQYIDVIAAGGLRRSYSLANADTANKKLELHIRKVANGQMSQYWFHEAKANDLLRLNGPLGTFFLRDSAGLDLVFLATGTGIAPVKAMLEGLGQLPAAALPRSVSIYWGARYEQELYCQMPASPVTPHFVPVLSRADQAWQGARGYVQDVFLAEHTDLQNVVVYACGSDAMIHSARTQLCDAGLPVRRFFADAFVCSAN